MMSATSNTPTNANTTKTTNTKRPNNVTCINCAQLFCVRKCRYVLQKLKLKLNSHTLACPPARPPPTLHKLDAEILSSRVQLK